MDSLGTYPVYLVGDDPITVTLFYHNLETTQTLLRERYDETVDEEENEEIWEKMKELGYPILEKETYRVSFSIYAWVESVDVEASSEEEAETLAMDIMADRRIEDYVTVDDYEVSEIYTVP